MINKTEPDWKYATWEGSRKMQLENSLRLTPKQRFEALEDFAQVSDWLANGKVVKKGSESNGI